MSDHGELLARIGLLKDITFLQKIERRKLELLEQKVKSLQPQQFVNPNSR